MIERAVSHNPRSIWTEAWAKPLAAAHRHTLFVIAIGDASIGKTFRLEMPWKRWIEDAMSFSFSAVVPIPYPVPGTIGDMCSASPLNRFRSVLLQWSKCRTVMSAMRIWNKQNRWDWEPWKWEPNAYLLPSTALCIIWFANSISDRAFNWFGSIKACSITAWISGLNDPMSVVSWPMPKPRPAMPRANASADDNDFDRCNVLTPLVFNGVTYDCCRFSLTMSDVWFESRANLTRGTDWNKRIKTKMSQRLISWAIRTHISVGRWHLWHLCVRHRHSHAHGSHLHWMCDENGSRWCSQIGHMYGMTACGQFLNLLLHIAARFRMQQRSIRLREKTHCASILIHRKLLRVHIQFILCSAVQSYICKETFANKWTVSRLENWNYSIKSDSCEIKLLGGR